MVICSYIHIDFPFVFFLYMADIAFANLTKHLPIGLCILRHFYVKRYCNKF